MHVLKTCFIDSSHPQCLTYVLTCTNKRVSGMMQVPGVTDITECLLFSNYQDITIAYFHAFSLPSGLTFRSPGPFSILQQLTSGGRRREAGGGKHIVPRQLSPCSYVPLLPLNTGFFNNISLLTSNSRHLPTLHPFPRKRNVKTNKVVI